MEDSDIQRMGDMFTDPLLSPDTENKPIIMAVGVGGGGGNAVNHMFRQGIKDVEFVVVNTDAAALRTSPVPQKVLIGSGLGAGAKPEVAKKAAEKDIDKIEGIFHDGIKMVFVTAGMGGGTGTGAGPVVAKIAKEKGMLTIGIVTIPFLFEGRKKIIKALQGADEMAQYVDALLVINNERLTEIYGDLDFLNAFGKADDTLTNAASSISEIITCNGYQNLDFEDVDTTLRASGAAIISTGYGEGENRLQMAIDDALHSPLLRNHDILKAKKLLLNLYYSSKAEHGFKTNEINAFTEFTQSIQDVDVIWGFGIDDSLGEGLKVTILASGFDVTITDNEKDKIIYTGHSEPTKSEDIDTQKIHDVYGKDANERHKDYAVLTRDQYDDEEIIDLMERTPTAKRTREELERIKAASHDSGNGEGSTQPSAKKAGEGGRVIGGFY